MKTQFILRISMGLVMLFAASLAYAEVTYLGTDTETQGDWIGKYGENGAIIFCNQEFHNSDLPVPYEADEAQGLFKKGLIEEISIVSSGASKAYGWIFNANPGDNKKAPWRVDGSDRYAACVSGRANDVAMTLTVNSTHYRVSIYSLDFDTTARNFQAFGYQGEDMPATPDDEIDKYTDGVYLSWEVTGQDPFRYYAKNGAGSVNYVASGLFIDEIGAGVDAQGKLSTLWGNLKQTP